MSKSFRALVVVGLVCGVTACGPISTTSAPQPGIEPPVRWSGGTPISDFDPARYWTRLGDPLIDAYVVQAIAANRDLAQAAARVAQARAGVSAARAGYFPRIDASAGVQRDVGDFADEQLEFSAGADAQWEIDLFGRVSGEFAASRAELAAAGYGLADLQRLIVGQVAQTTVAARALAVQLSIARETLAIQDENLQIAHWRLQAGLVSSLDVEQARAQRAQTAATIPALERDLAQAANTISVLIGEVPGSVLASIQVEAAPVPVPPDVTAFEAPAAVLRRRPDVRQAEAFLIADSARIGVARAQLLPLVRLTGTIGSASGGFDGLFDTITGGLFAGISQLIFDGGRARARVDTAEAVAEASLAAWEQAILEALEDVESAAAAQLAARERVAIFEVALDAANNAAILARSQYQTGLIDFQTLLTAESQLLSARNALAASKAEQANAFVDLTQALGGGWDADSLDPDNTEGNRGSTS